MDADDSETDDLLKHTHLQIYALERSAASFRQQVWSLALVAKIKKGALTLLEICTKQVL